MKKLLAEIKSDLLTYCGDWTQQGFWALLVCRYGAWRYTVHNSILRKPLSLFYKLLFKLIQVTTGIELPCEVKLGKGIRIDHFGGIIVSGYAQIGDNCIIRQGVTIGLKNDSQPCAPKVGNNVSIGAGAKLLGDITIGSGSIVGANAVVLKDVPENSLAVGVPAKILKRDF